MKVLNVSFGQDTGGQQWRLARAWRRFHAEDQYISAIRTVTFYPIENKIDRNLFRKEWWPEADVVHVNNDLRHLASGRVGNIDPREKPLVIHHHGTMFRTRPDYHLKALHEFGAIAICSTIDLHLIAPAETVWQPQSYELEELQEYRRQALQKDAEEGRDYSILRIAHAPTNRPIKGTDALVEAVTRLRNVGVKVELDIIEGVKHIECLKRKARADVFVDQLLLGYGCNAIEAWGMGIPVIAGVQPEKCAQLIRQEIPAETPQRMEEIWGGYPFLSATEETLFTALASMLKPEVRKQWADTGMAHFLKWHEAEVSTHRLRSIYQEAIDRHHA